MLRLNEVKLPLNHNEEALPAAILQKLGIASEDMLSFEVFKRAYDARNKADILLIYIVDIEVANQADLLAQFVNDPHVRETPDMTYKFVAKAPQNLTSRDRKSVV